MTAERLVAIMLCRVQTLGLYFSAAWCPPCQTFTPMLRSFYKITNQEFATLEVVYVPCDRSQGACVLALE